MHTTRLNTKTHDRNIGPKRWIAGAGILVGLALTLSACGGGKMVFQSADSDLDGGWIIIDGDSVSVIDPDSDGVQQAISDIENDEINPNSDAYDIENGALNDAKDMVTLKGGDGASIELSDGLIRLNGDYVYLDYDSDLAKSDREKVSPGD